MFFVYAKFCRNRMKIKEIEAGAEGTEAPPPSLLGKQSQSGNIRFTVGQY
jgi:hypothetical protein